MVVFRSRVRDRVLWFGIVMNTMVDWLGVIVWILRFGRAEMDRENS